MALRLVEYADPRVFHDAVIGRLLQSEAECCVQIGLIRRTTDAGYLPISIDELDQPLLWAIEDGPRIELVAVQTLKKMMGVTRGSAPAIACLAEGLAARQWSGISLVGVSPSIGFLADRYAQLSRRTATLAERLRVFQLDRVVWPKPVGGAMRLCRGEDRELLARLVAHFDAAVGETFVESAQSRVDRMLAEQRLFVWVGSKLAGSEIAGVELAGSEPVAMAAFNGPTPNGIRVSLVYTPPEHRGKGYASNLVAHLSQHLLDQARKFCFLFTDQANPTSNSIYQKLGYRAVSDSERWEFSG